MTPEQRQAARARCEAATPPPWEWRAEDAEMASTADADELVFGNTGRSRSDPTDEDGDFVAHARTDLPAALDALDAADTRIAELEAMIKQLSERCAAQAELLGKRAEKC